jgi:cholest-4-en-3-one 26-monooxygenase
MKINVLDPDVMVQGLPHDQYAYLREHEPCHWYETHDPDLLPDTWLVSRYEDVRAIDRDATRFISAKGVSMKAAQVTSKNMIVMDGEEHSRNRRMVSQAFTPRVVSTFERHFRELAVGIIEKALTESQFDFVTEIAMELPMHAIFDLLGVPAEDRYQCLTWANTFVSPSDPEIAASPQEAMAAAGALHQYGLKLAEQKRANHQEDLMSKLVQDLDGELLTDEELMGFTFLLIGAGAETTRNAIALGLHHLMEHPDQMTWLRGHLDPVPDTAVEEILRYGSIGGYMRRTAAEDVELHGTTIKAGDRVTYLYPSANYDPDAFPDPHTFDLKRTPNHHLTFGSGPHFCLGSHVARLEIRILFEEFLQRVAEVRPTGPIVRTRDSFVLGVKHLPIEVRTA